MKYVVHKFLMSDVEDPDVWAAESLYSWEHSEAGQWIMKNASEVPVWQRHFSNNSYGYEYQIVASLTPENYTYWKLKYE